MTALGHKQTISPILPQQPPSDVKQTVDRFQIRRNYREKGTGFIFRYRTTEQVLAEYDLAAKILGYKSDTIAIRIPVLERLQVRKDPLAGCLVRHRAEARTNVVDGMLRVRGFC